MNAQMEQVPGFLFFDHVAISVKPGELEAHVKAYQTMGFREIHREDVLGTDEIDRPWYRGDLKRLVDGCGLHIESRPLKIGPPLESGRLPPVEHRRRSLGRPREPPPSTVPEIPSTHTRARRRTQAWGHSRSHHRR